MAFISTVDELEATCTHARKLKVRISEPLPWQMFMELSEFQRAGGVEHRSYKNEKIGIGLLGLNCRPSNECPMIDNPVQQATARKIGSFLRSFRNTGSI